MSKSIFRKTIDRVRLSRDLIRRKFGIFLFDRNAIKSDKKPSADNIVVVRWDAKIGDSIVSSFFFRELKKAYPESKIQVITTQALSELYKSHFAVDAVHISKKRPSYSDLSKLAKQFESADIVIHLSKILKMKDLFFLNRVKAKNIVGLDSGVKLVNINLNQATLGQHFSSKYHAILELLDVDNIKTNYVIPNCPQVSERISNKINLQDKLVVAINPFGSSRNRQLPIEQVAKLIRLLKEEHSSLAILLVSPPSEQSSLTPLLQEFGEFCFVDTGGTTIYDAIELLRFASVVVSVDTSIIHIANGLNKKIVGLYNPDPINYQEWSPNRDDSITIFSEKDEIRGISIKSIAAATSKQLTK